jgi:hypothetical protein
MNAFDTLNEVREDTRRVRGKATQQRRTADTNIDESMCELGILMVGYNNAFIFFLKSRCLSRMHFCECRRKNVRKKDDEKEDAEDEENIML